MINPREKSLKAVLQEELAPLATEDDDLVVDESATEETASETFAISSYGADYSVDGLVKRVKSGAFFVPEFQRSYVWNQRQASRFVESLLMGLPVPGIFAFKETTSAKHLIVDGQQRLRTLQYFYDGIFKDRKFGLIDVRAAWAGKSYSELDETDRQRLDDAIVHTTVFRQDYPEEDKRSIYEVFERINTGGVKLSAQEIRACVSSGTFVDLLRELNDNESWRGIYGRKSERLKDQELILRFFALTNSRTEYRRPMRKFLNSFLDKNVELSAGIKKTFSKEFKSTVELVIAALGSKAFRPERQLNAAVFDAVMVGVVERLRASNKPPAPDKIASSYEALLKDKEFIESYTRSTADAQQVSGRIEKAVQAFANC